MIQTSMDRTGVRVGNVIRGFALALMFGAMAIAVPTARAQVLYGSITGTVADASGAVVVAATIAGAILGGFQLNGQVSHVSGAPFSVSPASNTINDPGGTEYADLVKPYVQLGGHNRTVGNTVVNGGSPWFDPTAFANPVEPQYTNSSGPGYVNCSVPSCMVAPHFGNTHRNEFRGPGVTYLNASVFRGFHIYGESQFQIRVEAFNVLNHPQLTSNPNVTVGGGTFGYITGFGGTRSLQFSGRINF
jgi:hypothetical protein